MRIPTLIAGVILIAHAGTRLAAADSSAPGTWLDSRIQSGHHVRVSARGGLLESRDARAVADGIAYHGVLASTFPEPIPVPGLIAWHQIDEVEVKGNAALSGAIVGGVAGAAVLGTLAGLYLPQEGRNAGSITAAAVGGAAVGAVTGLVLGAGVGALVPAWHRVYHSKGGSP